MTWQEEAREVLARALYLRQARQFIHPDDVDTPEERWEAGHAPRRAWLSAADALLPDLAPVVAAEVARAEARGKVVALRAMAGEIRSAVGPVVPHKGGSAGTFTNAPNGDAMRLWSYGNALAYTGATIEVLGLIDDRADAIEAEAGERR